MSVSVYSPETSCRRVVTLRFVDAARRSLVLRVKRYIMDNLARPELSPQLIAAHHHISVRYLHKLFASESTTLSRWILRARLEQCRRDLAGATTPVGVIARRWGFTSAARFSRVFKDAYGMPPRDFQLGTVRPWSNTSGQPSVRPGNGSTVQTAPATRS